MKNAEFLELISKDPNLGFEKTGLVAFKDIAEATDEVLNKRLPDLQGMNLPEGKTLIIHQLLQATAHDPEDETGSKLKNGRKATPGAFFRASLEGESGVLRIPVATLCGALPDFEDSRVKDHTDATMIRDIKLSLKQPGVEQRTMPLAKYARGLVGHSFKIERVFKNINRMTAPGDGWPGGIIGSTIVLLSDRKKAE